MLLNAYYSAEAVHAQSEDELERRASDLATYIRPLRPVGAAIPEPSCDPRLNNS